MRGTGCRVIQYISCSAKVLCPEHLMVPGCSLVPLVSHDAHDCLQERLRAFTAKHPKYSRLPGVVLVQQAKQRVEAAMCQTRVQVPCRLTARPSCSVHLWLRHLASEVPLFAPANPSP